MIDHTAAFGERAGVEGKLIADGVVEFGIGEPGNVVEISRDAGTFFDVVGDVDAFAGDKVVADFGEEASCDEFVSAGLEVAATDRIAGLQAGQSGDLSFGKDFLAVDADISEAGGASIRLLSEGWSGIGKNCQKKCAGKEAKSADASHASSVAVFLGSALVGEGRKKKRAENPDEVMLKWGVALLRP